MGVDAPPRRRLGHDKAFVPALEASVAGGGSTSTSRPNTFATTASRPTATSTRGASWLPARRVASRRRGWPAHRAYGGERDIQRGPFAQVTWGPVTIGGFWFNPGSSNQVFVGSIGAAF